MNKRVLIIVTSTPLIDGTGHPTGTWADDIAIPYYALREARCLVDFASPLGGTAPIDPRSLCEVEGALRRLAPLLSDAARVDGWLDRVGGAGGAGGLVLIGRRHLRTNNSWMHNAPSLVKGPDRAQLLMHPEDAAARGLQEGAGARVASRVGAVTATVKLTGDIMRGVVSLPHGYGHGDAKDTLRVAGALPGANVNAVTDDALVEPLLGTAILNGVPVEVGPA